MSNSNGKEVSYLAIPETIHIPRVGQLGPVIDLTNAVIESKIKGLTFTKQEDGVLITAGPASKASGLEFLIPIGFCKFIQFKSQPKPSSK